VENEPGQTTIRLNHFFQESPWPPISRAENRVTQVKGARPANQKCCGTTKETSHIPELCQLHDPEKCQLRAAAIQQPENNDLPVHTPPTGFDALRTIAVSRIYLDNFDHITAYWVGLGLKLAQVALSYGADDLHGTILEEHIFHMAGATSPQLQTEADMIKAIREAGPHAGATEYVLRTDQSFGRRALSQ
jgi:hypothetical protein